MELSKKNHRFENTEIIKKEIDVGLKIDFNRFLLEKSVALFCA